MSINTVSLNELVENSQIIWLKEHTMPEDEILTSGLYKRGVWEAGTGEVKEYSEIDKEMYAPNAPEGEDYAEARVQQGYTKTVKPVRRGIVVTITWQMRQRNKYGEIKSKLETWSSTVKNRMLLDLSHRFTYMTATSYTDKDGSTVDTSMGDALALAYSAHLVKGTSTTYRNRLAGNPALSKGSLELMEKMVIENTMNQFGEQELSVDYDVLWTFKDPNTINMARVLLNSTADPDAPNAGVLNVNKAKYRLVTIHRGNTTAAGVALTDNTKNKYWGLVATPIFAAYLDIETPPTPIEPEEKYNGDVLFGADGSYSICIVSGKGFAGSTGDGAA